MILVYFEKSIMLLVQAMHEVTEQTGMKNTQGCLAAGANSPKAPSSTYSSEDSLPDGCLAVLSARCCRFNKNAPKILFSFSEAHFLLKNLFVSK